MTKYLKSAKYIQNILQNFTTKVVLKFLKRQFLHDLINIKFAHFFLTLEPNFLIVKNADCNQIVNDIFMRRTINNYNTHSLTCRVLFRLTRSVITKTLPIFFEFINASALNFILDCKYFRSSGLPREARRLK